MGGCLSLDDEERKARLRSAQIDRQIAELARQECNVIKILLLGAGESGKSTIVKQMKIIHSEGFSDEELRSFRPTVLDNLLGSMKYVLTGMGILRINLENPKNKALKGITADHSARYQHFLQLTGAICIAAAYSASDHEAARQSCERPVEVEQVLGLTVCIVEPTAFARATELYVYFRCSHGYGNSRALSDAS
ncbi:hypothetical protein HPB51_001357 [Rhipicephalus microplus]|uniref:Uncharacterized protein n=1 Tax=Rhipicephalus microplus TaxID=6941 RepID=A0A9J6EQ60_RHIMP|nr:hypothetical protein HPB51_001357 [Rhipicephalus microplus]